MNKIVESCRKCGKNVSVVYGVYLKAYQCLHCGHRAIILIWVTESAAPKSRK